MNDSAKSMYSGATVSKCVSSVRSFSSDFDIDQITAVSAGYQGSVGTSRLQEKSCLSILRPFLDERTGGFRSYFFVRSKDYFQRNLKSKLLQSFNCVDSVGYATFHVGAPGAVAESIVHSERSGGDGSVRKDCVSMTNKKDSFFVGICFTVESARDGISMNVGFLFSYFSSHQFADFCQKIS